MLKEVVTAAGELEQNMGGSSAVFKEYATTLQQYAAQAYQTMGLSQSQYLATANKMGALFQGSGFSIAESVDLTSAAMQRAADVASIMGIDVSSAMEAVAGAAKGNFTMMDNLGVAINDTTLQIYAQEKGLGKLETTQQKVNAAMMMFLETSEYAAGNYARENATFAGSLQTFKAELQNAAAEIGTELLPTATQGIRVIGAVMEDLKPVVKDVSAGINTIGSAMEILENPAMRTIAYTLAISTAMSKMKLALGGPLSTLVMLGSVLTWIVGKFGQTQEATAETTDKAMETAAVSTESAAKSAEKLNNEYKEVEKTVKNMTAPFDEITKLSGGSTLGSKLVSADDVENLENINAELDNLNKDYTIDVKVPDIELPELDLSEVDWDVIKTNLESWIEEQDWRKSFQDVESAFIDLFSVGLDIVDGIFGTHIAEWYDKVTNFFFDYGAGLQSASDPADEGLQALEKYEQEHNGRSAWSDFYAYYKAGVSPYEAFERVYSTPNMKKGFLAANGNLATYYVDEWAGLSMEDLAERLNPEKQAEDLVAQSYRINDDSFMGIEGGFKSLVYNSFADYVDPDIHRSSTGGDFGGLGSMRIDPSNVTTPLTAQDAYAMFGNSAFGGIPAAGATFNISLNLDEEVVGRAAINYADGQIEVTNGK